ncbi:MAG: hypothetical protein A2705_04470 [Omnitrophica WOR_2 bacterium RIFCSPHIGHO2_01_FULL_52_10]|nr:MAG: hypothetical protein A2705_04470 [Omnitrophica WOR_2 bacterium RIFCSPHIGHO2_01_FULL_52_10]
MEIFNKSKNTVIAQNARLADTFGARMKGLLGRVELRAGEALVITKCQSIHMFFMRFAIDAIFVDGNNRVVGLVEGIKPFRLSPIFFRAKYVIELKPGTIAAAKTSLHDQLESSTSIV